MKILVFGITGSIGTSLLDVLNKHTIVGVSYFNNISLAKDIIKKHNIEHYYSPNHKEYSTVNSIVDLINNTEPDLIVNAVTGFAGLEYTLKSIEAKINIALANKESLVMGGNLITKQMKDNNIKIFPIDSEHSALYELIHKHDQIKNLYITCSGGSCYTKSNEELQNIKYSEVVTHPNWSMGEKITHDSATLMNKCFEIIEAYHLFQTKNIFALYHPQSIIHGMVEFNDNTVFANMSQPDMKVAIELALNEFNKSSKPNIKQLDFKNLTLNLSEIDKDKWIPIKWAYDVINDTNNSLGVIITVANEKAIEAFKKGEIQFTQFYSYIQKYIDTYKNTVINSFDDLYKLVNIINSN
ncbi:MAG: hypothetical protein ACRC42_03250 [Mycoplasma sp.]